MKQNPIAGVGAAFLATVALASCVRYVPPPPPPPPPPPLPPRHELFVRAACSPCTIEIGKTSTINALARSSIGCPVTYAWSAPAAAFTSSQAQTTTWTAPIQAGPVPVTVTATCPMDGMTARDTVTVTVVKPAVLTAPATIPVLYGTNRHWEGGPNNYDFTYSKTLEYGICPATIPANFDQLVADRSEGTFWDYVAKIPVIGGQIAPPVEGADYIRPGSAERLSESSFELRLRNNVAISANKSIFIFVHGFANSFNDACRRTAQMAWDLNLASAPLMFTWPATGQVTTYTQDLQNALNSVDQMVAFLRLVAQRSGATSINVIAHSLGNRLLLAALKSLEERGLATNAFLDQVVLAAPDIDRTAFDLAYPALRRLSKRASIYASSHDSALKLSRGFWRGGPRLGESRFLEVFDGIDTIDVSAIDFQLFGMGHAYFANNRLVINHIVELLGKGTAPPRTHLQKRWVTGTERIYWQFPK